MEFGILGPFQLRDADGCERPTAARQRNLLALLVLHAGESVPRERLIDALWGSALPDNPGNALQQRVFHVRKLLDAASPDARLVTAPAGYRLEVAPEQVDVARFRRRHQQGGAALSRDDPAAAAEHLQAALAQWRGSALQDVDAPWTAPAAQQLEEERLRAGESAAEAELRLGSLDSAAARLQQIVAAHPLREQAHGQLMRALALAGRQADALAVYDAIRTNLAEELGLDPSPQLQQLHTDVLSQRLPPVPAAATVAPTAASGTSGTHPPTDRTLRGPRARTLPPAPTSSFVGRDTEQGRLADLLSSDRVVTVTGPGGAGKTRLVTELLLRRPPNDDVVFVELATLQDPGALPAVVADAAGVHGPAGTAMLELVRSTLAARPTVLVLDNCEHLLDAVAALLDGLLPSCPRLTVLATSREPLGIDGEVVWPLDTLAVPEEDVTSLTDAAAAPAVALLLERVRSAAPHLEVGDDQTPAVVRIARDLDGLPLALELAAARARVMSLEEIADHLDDRFTLLAGGRRSAPARHRALSAALDWSWELLDEADRRAWIAAALPATAFTLELFAPVLAALDPDRDALDAVSALTDRSLVRIEARGQPTRYRMLASLREFGLGQAPDPELLARGAHAHAAHVERAVSAAERVDSDRWSIDLEEQRRWLPDLRQALGWRLEGGDAHGAQRLAAAVGWLAFLTPLTGEGRRLLDRSLGPLEGLTAVEVEPRAALWAAGLRVGDADAEGARWAQLAREAAEDAGDGFCAELALAFATTFRLLDNEAEAALEVMLQRAASTTGLLEGTWRLLAAKVLTALGRLAEAEHEAVRSVDLLDAAGAPSHLFAGDVLVHLPQLRGDVTAVRTAAERCIAACRAHDAAEPEVELLGMLAMVEAAVGAHDRADELLTHARAITRRSAWPMVEAIVAQAEGYARWRAGDTTGARTAWEQALELHDWTGLGFGEPFILWGLGHLGLAAGDQRGAFERFQQALATATERSDRDLLATACEGLAALGLAVACDTLAAQLLGSAGALRAGMGAPAPVITHELAAGTATEVVDRLGDQQAAAARDVGAALDPAGLATLMGKLATRVGVSEPTG